MTLVANSLKTAIRVVLHDDITKDRWQMVKSAFPLGKNMNENTHVFDGTLYTNKNGQTRFLIAALPISVADELTKEAVEKTGSIHKIKRLDTIENIYFQEYAPACRPSDSVLVIFPQESGLRILQITNSLPFSSHVISNHPEHKMAEFLRVLKSVTAQEAVKHRAVLLTTAEFSWISEILTENNFAIFQESLSR